MSEKLQKLELTWPGKDERFNPEPRILLEDTGKSYSKEPTEEGPIKPTFDNMLIHGDNLLALKALEQDYTGQVKCIYIDPPYNTGNAFEHYDDGLEHSIWLSLMRDRLEILRKLLADDGMIFVQIDDNEQAYLKVLMDEVFGRNNFRECITLKTSTASGVNAVNVKRGERLFKLKEYILYYSKTPSSRFYPIYVKTDFNFNYKYEVKFENGRYTVKDMTTVYKGDDFKNYCLLNFENMYSLEKNNQKAGEKVKEVIKQSLSTDDVLEFKNSYGKNVLIWRGGVFTPLNERIIKDADEVSFGLLISDFWDDQIFQTNKAEGGVEFKASKKPEKLIRRILQLSTKPGDLVLDSFLGSGTTAAVAHKMGRKWIGIEMGDHVYSHCLPRLTKVINGEDQGGITKATGWKNGGGFKFYELASSLIVKDRYGQQVISDKYNADMLAEAMCKILDYHYKPDKEKYWKQGFSSEKSFIYTTTMSMQETSLSALAEEVGDNNLLICCSAFRGNTNAYPNISVKKIPAAILKKCEWGATGYPFQLKDYHPKAEDFEFDEEEE